MKIYGATKPETVQCRYGCCGGGLHRGAPNGRQKKVLAKRARKRARREGKRDAFQSED